MKTLEKVMEVNPFESQKSQKQPEKEAKAKTGIDKDIEKTMEHYNNVTKKELSFTVAERKINRFKLRTLDPVQVNILFKRIITETKSEFRKEGMFISKIIQHSYTKGYNDFILDTGDFKIEYFGYHLVGKPKNPIRIKIRGNSGTNLSQMSKYVEYDIDGEVDEYSLSVLSSNCKYNIRDKKVYDRIKSFVPKEKSIGHKFIKNKINDF